VSEELLTLEDIAAMYRCSYRHARDAIVKTIGFPVIAPGSTNRNPLWVRTEVRAFLNRKPAKSRTIHANLAVSL
jgi:O-acetyl-ADP-ribose deacetylase (regulator of RNase III)